MVTGSGLGSLIPVAMSLVGVVTILKARYHRKRGKTEPVDEDFDKHRAATLESERRMAAYLASRDRQG
jgi:hypothetical protein